MFNLIQLFFATFLGYTYIANAHASEPMYSISFELPLSSPIYFSDYDQREDGSYFLKDRSTGRVAALHRNSSKDRRVRLLLETLNLPSQSYFVAMDFPSPEVANAFWVYLAQPRSNILHILGSEGSVVHQPMLSKPMVTPTGVPHDPVLTMQIEYLKAKTLEGQGMLAFYSLGLEHQPLIQFSGGKIPPPELPSNYFDEESVLIDAIITQLTLDGYSGRAIYRTVKALRPGRSHSVIKLFCDTVLKNTLREKVDPQGPY